MRFGWNFDVEVCYGEIEDEFGCCSYGFDVLNENNCNDIIINVSYYKN